MGASSSRVPSSQRDRRRHRGVENLAQALALVPPPILNGENPFMHTRWRGMDFTIAGLSGAGALATIGIVVVGLRMLVFTGFTPRVGGGSACHVRRTHTFMKCSNHTQDYGGQPCA
jgi:hypothetical protein